MRVTVRLFARLRELAGGAEFTREVPDDATVDLVWRQLVADVPALADYERSLSCAVNAEYRSSGPGWRTETKSRSCRRCPGAEPAPPGPV